MIDVVVVLRAEDAVLDFLTVLAEPGGETYAVLADTRTVLHLPREAPVAEQLELLADALRPAGALSEPAGAEWLARTVREAAGGRAARVWTHSPADNRRTRGRLGRDTAAAPHGLPVTHAVGCSPFLQVLSDRDRPLGADLVAAKTGFVNRHCGPLLHRADPEYLVDTPRVPAAERFFASRPEERDRLFALLASLGDEAASVADPWEFDTSPYENERLDATTAWIAVHHTPDDGPLVELGACEGALTHRLAGKGFRVHVTEPNPLFHARLAASIPGDGGGAVDVHRLGLADLAAGRGPRGTAHLLVEMLHYGQEGAELDALPGESLFLALEPEALETRWKPWMETSAQWRPVAETRLVAPRLESVCAGRAYLSKRGSTGVLLRRR